MFSGFLFVFCLSEAMSVTYFWCRKASFSNVPLARTPSCGRDTALAAKEESQQKEEFDIPYFTLGFGLLESTQLHPSMLLEQFWPTWRVFKYFFVAADNCVWNQCGYIEHSHTNMEIGIVLFLALKRQYKPKFPLQSHLALNWNIKKKVQFILKNNF